MIVREGVTPVAIFGVASAAVGSLWGWLVASPLLLLSTAAAWAFWERERSVPADPEAAVSPMDGCIDSVTTGRDPWLDRDVTRIAIRVRPPGIGVLRSPIEGKIMDFWVAPSPAKRRGHWSRWLNPFARYAVWIRTDEGDDVVLEVSSSRPFSRLRFSAAVGERTGHGQRNGFVYFATRVRVLVANGSKNIIASGNRVHGGEDILAILVPRQRG